VSSLQSFLHVLLKHTELRKDRVPRFLFAAWSPPTGVQLVDAEERNLPLPSFTPDHIIPAAFLTVQRRSLAAGPAGKPFYDHSESSLLQSASAHLDGMIHRSEFSTWTASLAGAFFYAAKLAKEKQKDIYVTMIDTKRLDGGALIWYAPDLLGDTCSVHEYLAHGPVRGEAFKTASWPDLLREGLDKFFEPIQHSSVEKYGQDVIATIFEQYDADIHGVQHAMRIADLFGELRDIVVVILLAMQPRSVNHVRGRHKYEMLQKLCKDLGRKEEVAMLANETWLNTPGAMYVDGSRDVREWMSLLYTLASANRLDIFWD
jgi:hypothetical protein